MINLQMTKFDCDRTCPEFERAVSGLFLCRFNPILAVIGHVVAHSHTAELAVDYSDRDALKAAVEKIGGIWYGKGHFHLFDSEQDGYGFRLRMPGHGWTSDLGKDGKLRNIAKEGEASYWYHPCCLRDGKLYYDSYGGSWGDVSQLARLKAEYIEQSAFVKVETQAQLLGWQTERQEGKLLVYCPTGGVLAITSGGDVSTAGFAGGGCHTAREQLGVAVEEGSIRPTAEACKVPATIQQGG